MNVWVGHGADRAIFCNPRSRYKTDVRAIALVGPHLLNRASWEYLTDQGFTCVLWNVLAREWERPEGWAKPTLSEVCQLDWSVVVVHDISSDMPNQLAYFLDELVALGAEFRQDFPDSCVPMRRGIANPTIASGIIRMDGPAV